MRTIETTTRTANVENKNWKQYTHFYEITEQRCTYGAPNGTLVILYTKSNFVCTKVNFVQQKKNYQQNTKINFILQN
jgi:hypothetical protein